MATTGAAAPDRAFELFVKRCLSGIQKESWGRGKDARDLRDACQNVLNLLSEHEQGVATYGGSLAVAVLEPLYLACTSPNPKIVEAALGCLHKLVAHAWLQGESSSSGQANDADVVSKVIRTVIQCAESAAGAEVSQQLAIIRALLTFTTAEHFVAHGDCLLAAVRMVFNLALGSEDEIIKRTASNALLQMLNTIAKRVTAFPLFATSSAGTSRTASVDGSGLSHIATTSSVSAAQHAAHAAAHAQYAADVSGGGMQRIRSTNSVTGGARSVHEAQAIPGGHQPRSASPHSSADVGVREGSADAAGAAARRSLAAVPDCEEPDADAAETDAADADGRAEQLASLAERQDLRGLEAAIGKPQLDLELEADTVAEVDDEEGPAVVHHIVLSHGPSISLRTSSVAGSAHAAMAVQATRGALGASSGGHTPKSPVHPGLQPELHGEAGLGARAVAAAAAALAPIADGLEGAAAAEGPADAAPAAPHGASAGHKGGSPFTTDDAPGQALGPDRGPAQVAPEPPATPTHAHPAVASPHTVAVARGAAAARPPLRTNERDVLLVLRAFCKLAEREAGVTDIDSYLHQGKLMALELLVKVLQNPQHSWDNVRDEFVAHLHQPLSMVLLRNYSPSDLPSFTWGLKLITALMLHPKLRRGLKAEMGAFYPLLLLRPLEADTAPSSSDLSAIAALLPCLRHLCAEPQLLVDLFVNYDCEMRAPNLYERTVQALSKLSQLTVVDGPAQPTGKQQQQEVARQLAAVREAATACLMSIVSSLDAWSTPLKEALQQQQRGAEGVAGAAAGHEANGTTVQRRTSGNTAGGGASHGRGGSFVGSGSSSSLHAALPSAASGSSFSAGPPSLAKTSVGVGSASGGAASDAGRVEAAKVTKSSLEQGLAMFNGGNPVKAMRFLISSGLVENSPTGAAVFMRAHAAELDLAALGEYFGHHEDFEISVMHAFIDMERFGGVTIDVALRRLLAQFRLPGEAQKIDRIMEKFAERFCRDNPGVFRDADAAYVLAFAIIMLNTDAHNPLAERRLAKSDFVAMNSQPAAQPAAPLDEPVAPGSRQQSAAGQQDAASPAEGGGTGAAQAPEEGAANGEDGGDGAAASFDAEAANPSPSGLPAAAGAPAPPPAPAAAGPGSYNINSVLTMEPVIPQADLEGIYDRIVSQEIIVRQGMGDGRGGASGLAAKANGRGNKLAAALGLRALAAPLRSTLGSWDKKQVGDAERRRRQQVIIIDSHMRAVAAREAGSTWYTSLHAEHTRPMLSVSGAALLNALAFAFRTLQPHGSHLDGSGAAPGAPQAQLQAADMRQADALLAGMVTLAELAGLLGLEAMCEQVITSLAQAASVSRPAMYGSTEGRKQLAALRALLGAAVGPEAGQLGSAWAVILRAASELEALVRVLTRPLQPGEAGQGVQLVPPPAAYATATNTTSGGGAGGQSRGVSNGGAPSTSASTTSTSGYSPIGKMFLALGLISGNSNGGSTNSSSGGAAPPPAPPPANSVQVGRTASSSASGPPTLPPPPVRALPGGVMVMWAVTEGRAIMEQVYQRTNSLDGEAVVVFFRALCAVSREELDAAEPRIYSLQRLVEVAQLNMACRIRLIASKIWAVTSAHLVMAACHTQQAVATQAVDAMRLLSGKLLSRPELAHYTAQEAALRPFTAVLRQADDAGVRQLAVQCVMQAMSAHSRSLGSGWKMVIEVMRRGAADPSPHVYLQALLGLRDVVGALYIGQPESSGSGGVGTSGSGGHDCFQEVLRAVLAALRNPYHPDHAVSGVQLLLQLGQRLALRLGAPAAAGGQGAASADDPGDGDEDVGVDRLSAGGGGVGSGGRSRSGAGVASSSSRAASTTLPAAAVALTSQASSAAAAMQQLQLTYGWLWADTGPLAERALAAAAAGDDWGLLLEVVADIAATLEHPRLANTGIEASFELMTSYGPRWSRRAWRVMLGAVLDRVAFRVPPALDPQAHPDAAKQALAAGLPLEPIATGFVARVERWFPLLCMQLGPVRAAQGPAVALELLQLLTSTAVRWFQHSMEFVSRAGLSALSRVLAALAAHGAPQRQSGSGAATSSGGASGGGAAGASWQQEWAVLVPILSSTLTDELNAVIPFTRGLAAKQQRRLQSRPRKSYAAPVAATSADTKRLRLRCRMLVLLHRTVAAELLRSADSMPWDVVRQLVQLLVDAAQQTMRFNMDEELHVAAGQHEEEEVRSSCAASSITAAGEDDAAVQRSSLSVSSAWSASAFARFSKTEGPARHGNGVRRAARDSQDGAAAASPAVTPRSEVSNEHFAQVDSRKGSAVHVRGAGGDSMTMAAAPISILAGARLQLPSAQLQLSSATSHDSLRPALVSLETEPLDAAVTILLRCMLLQPAPAAAEEAKQLLLQLCQHVVQCHAEAQPVYSPPNHAAESSPDDPAALDPALPGASWDHAVRAPVLARCLTVLLQHTPTEVQRLALLPQLLVLLGSHQTVVRAAVADYLERVLGPLVEAGGGQGVLPEASAASASK